MLNYINKIIIIYYNELFEQLRTSINEQKYGTSHHVMESGRQGRIDGEYLRRNITLISYSVVSKSMVIRMHGDKLCPYAETETVCNREFCEGCDIFEKFCKKLAKSDKALDYTLPYLQKPTDRKKW